MYYFNIHEKKVILLALFNKNEIYIINITQVLARILFTVFSLSIRFCKWTFAVSNSSILAWASRNCKYEKKNILNFFISF